MEKRQLGSTGIEVSRLGLGTVKFGRNEGVKYPQGFEIPDDTHLANLLDLAKDLGINLLDTAPAYGTSEERLGTLLKGQREDWIIVGKAGEEFENGRSFYNFSPDYFERSLQRSLQRLQTDYIDILLLHSDGNDLENLSDEMIAKLHDFKKRGLVRAIGASTKTEAGSLKTLETMDVVMAMYTQEYQEERPVLDYATEQNKGVLLKKVLNSGHVVTAPPPTAGTASHEANPRVPPPGGGRLGGGDDAIVNAFHFAFNHPGTTAAIVGTINPVHLRANVEAFQNIASPHRGEDRKS